MPRTTRAHSSGFADRVGGRPVAIVPHRGMLWVTSADSASHLAILCEAAEKELDALADLRARAVFLDGN